MLEIRECARCHRELKISNFAEGSNLCKPCKVIYNREYYRTKEGRIKLMLKNFKPKSEDRNHKLFNTSLEIFTIWLVNNNFNLLFKTWVESNYSRDTLPSVDRLDSTKPYSYENMRLVTWKENNEAAYNERRTGKRVTRQNKQICQLDLNGVFIDSFKSISLAARELGFCRTNINSCLKGKHKIAHGFRWEYLENQLPNVPTNRDKK